MYLLETLLLMLLTSCVTSPAAAER